MLIVLSGSQLFFGLTYINTCLKYSGAPKKPTTAFSSLERRPRREGLGQPFVRQPALVRLLNSGAFAAGAPLQRGPMVMARVRYLPNSGNSA